MKMKSKLFVVIIFMCFMMLMCSCDFTSNEKLYFSEKENYVIGTGTVIDVELDEEYNALYIGIENERPFIEGGGFRVTGKNLELLLNNGILEKAIPGKQISFIAPPRFFGSGYAIPLVELCIDGEELLDFETGFYNLNQEYGNPGFQ